MTSCKLTSHAVKMRLYKAVGISPHSCLAKAKGGLVVAGVCVLQEVKTEKSVRATLQPCEEWPMEHLTQSWSQVELSRSYDTAQGKTSWVFRLYSKHIHLAMHLKAQNTLWHKYLSSNFSKKGTLCFLRFAKCFKLCSSTITTYIVFTLTHYTFTYL